MRKSRYPGAQGQARDAGVRIGLQGSAGIKRSPEVSLMSKDGVEKELGIILANINTLVSTGRRAMDVPEFEAAKKEVEEKWERILGRCRILASSLNASELSDTDLFIRVYEAGASSSLVAGNLEFYLSCQSRLLGELYPRFEIEKGNVHDHLYDYCANFLLYFGCFSRDNVELNAFMRGMSLPALKNKEVQFALKAVSMFDAGDYIGFEKMFRRAGWRHKTLMLPARSERRIETLRTMVKAYLSLSKDETCELLSLTDRSKAEHLLATERPDLSYLNCNPGTDLFYFRARKR